MSIMNVKIGVPKKTRAARVRTGSGGIVRYLLLVLLSFMVYPILAQQDKKEIIKGNVNYETEEYSAAETNYKRALEINKKSYAAAYNLANSLYKQGRYEEAANEYQGLSHRPSSKDTMAMVQHNLGNALLKQKKYADAISAYKNALKNNPQAEDSRYNLAYAQRMLEQQKNQQKDKNESGNDKEGDSSDGENKNNKDDKENKNKKEQEKKEQDRKDKNQKENEEKQQEKEEQQQNKLSKEDAQRLLDALQNDEKKLQDKLQKGKTKKGVPVTIEKDW